MQLESIFQTLQSDNYEVTFDYHIDVSQRSNNMTLSSTEFNQSGSDFVHFNQKYNKNHFREYLETQEDEIFESACNRSSIENSTIIKDHTLDTIFIVMDPNQPPEKVASKL